MGKKERKEKKERKRQRKALKRTGIVLPHDTLRVYPYEGMIRGEAYQYRSGMREIMTGMLSDPGFSLEDKLWVVLLFNAPYRPGDKFIWDITQTPGVTECAKPQPLTNTRWEKGAKGQLAVLFADNPVWPGDFPYPPEVAIVYVSDSGRLIAYYPIMADIKGSLTISWSESGVIGIA